MIDERKSDNRQLLPRWTLFNKSPKISPYAPRNKELKESQADFIIACEEWRKNKTLGFAFDVVSYGKIVLAEDTKDYKEAFDLISRSDYASVFNEISNIDQESKIVNKNDVIQLIADNKKHLLLYPNNPLVWLDQAYLYFIMGQEKQAEKCIEMTKAFNNSNAFVLRAIASYYVQKKDPDKALYYLNNSEYKDSDPRILSAKIAITSTVKNNYRFKKISNFDISPMSSELYAEYATLEFQNGNARSAKHALKEAMDFPNENIYAQKVFLEDQYGLTGLPLNYEVPYDYEAQSKIAFLSGDYDKAIEEAGNWVDLFPFSVDATSFYSSINMSYHHEYLHTEEILRTSLRISPNDVALLNNMSFCLASSGKFVEAKQFLDRAFNQEMNEYYKNIILATKGYLLFKTGKKEEATKCYLDAIHGFEQNKEYLCVSKALYIFGKEEMKFDKENGLARIKESLEKAIKYDYRFLIEIAKKEFPLYRFV